jgi:3-phosphoshikimate 1-carboxyvinyltransferase
MNLIVNGCPMVSGNISVGGDKSITHRCLIIGAIGEGKTVVYNYSRADDCFSTLRCLKEMGVEIDIDNKRIVINGRGINGLREPEDILDCGNSGTTMRLLAGLLAGQEFYSVLTGDESLRNRPMQRIIDPLNLMGAQVLGRKGGYAPLSIIGGRLKGIQYKLPIPSAQIKSALMLAGLYADKKTVIEEPYPSRDHTERLFGYFKIRFKREKNRIIVFPGRRFKGRKIVVPNDISSSAFFIVLGILRGEKLILRQTGINHFRIGLIEILKSSGGDITLINKRNFGNEPVADIIVKRSDIKPFSISRPMIPRLIDEIPVLAVLATQLKGRTVIKDAQELRVKETDRIRAICNELKKFGAEMEETEDGMIINGPNRLKGAVCESYKDHRIAMALSIAGLIAKGKTIIKDVDCINISFPGFVDILKEVCGEEYVRIQDGFKKV